MTQPVLTQPVLIRATRWLAIGFAASLMVITGCSSPNTASNTAETATEPSAETAETATTETETTETAQQPAVDDAAKPDAAGKISSRVVENVTLAPGADPLAMVVATRQPNAEPTGVEQMKLTYPSPEKAVVLVTKSELGDDSVASIRTRYEFAPVDTADGTRQWQLTQVTEQNKCQPNRGSQDWTGDLCQ
ncbi:MAG: hypothetical protein MUF72_15940 [Elainella sp. Prado103]|jgi:hypothetical protein|nr:hypothetical protein [Elainella sp. Prado103]